jgi:zinc finger CCHC domain-containing protein 9
MTRFARKNGISERREDKKKKEEATEWNSMFEDGKESSSSNQEQKNDDNNYNENFKSNRFNNNKNFDRTKGFNNNRNESGGDDYIKQCMQEMDPMVLAELNDLKRKRKITNFEYYQQIKLQARSNRRRLMRQKEREQKRVCFNCRKPGHTVNECPEGKKDAEQGTGVCYKCGSTEHSITACKVRLEPGNFPFAKCFICKEMGHLSKQCPDNPRGLYPNGVFFYY